MSEMTLRIQIAKSTKLIISAGEAEMSLAMPSTSGVSDTSRLNISVGGEAKIILKGSEIRSIS